MAQGCLSVLVRAAEKEKGFYVAERKDDRKKLRNVEVA
jgi:hypothetical protein